jgi:hypothetical protein
VFRWTCRRTSLTRRLETFLQITLSDRIKNAHFSRRYVGLSVAEVVRTSTVSVHDLCCFDFENPDDLVKANREQTTKEGPKPVDPVIAREVMSGDCSAERACRVQRCSGERTTDQLCDEKG